MFIEIAQSYAAIKKSMKSYLAGLPFMICKLVEAQWKLLLGVPKPLLDRKLS